MKFALSRDGHLSLTRKLSLIQVTWQFSVPYKQHQYVTYAEKGRKTD